MKFLIVGPNQGKSGDWGGFRFKDGVCEVSEAQATDVENARRILSRFYSAYPDVELTKLPDGKLVRTCNISEEHIPDDESLFSKPVIGDDMEIQNLVSDDGLDGKAAVKLVEVGYSTVGELRKAPDEDLIRIKGFGGKMVKRIRSLVGYADGLVAETCKD